MVGILINWLNIVRLLTIPAIIMYFAYLYFYTGKAVLVSNGLQLVMDVSLLVFPLCLSLAIVINYYLLKLIQRLQTQGQKIALANKD